jgi:hypothetical protein
LVPHHRHRHHRLWCRITGTVIIVFGAASPAPPSLLSFIAWPYKLKIFIFVFSSLVFLHRHHHHRHHHRRLITGIIITGSSPASSSPASSSPAPPSLSLWCRITGTAVIVSPFLYCLAA